MERKIIYIFFILILHLTLSTNISTKEMEKVTFSHLKASLKEKSFYYFFNEEKKINISNVEINIEIEASQNGNLSLIFSKDNAQYESNPKDSLVIRVASIQEEEKSNIFLQVQKCFNKSEICSEDKKNIIRIEPIQRETEKNPKEILSMNKGEYLTNIKLDIIIDSKEIKILYARNAIFSDFFDTNKIFGNSAYFQLKSTKIRNNKTLIKNFTMYYVPLTTNPKELRKIEEGQTENEETKLVHIEVVDYCIQSSPNILRKGNTYIIPRVLLNPKDKNGNFPLYIKNCTFKYLKNLFNITHSKNADFYFGVSITLQNELAITLKTEIPGEIYIGSKYFNNTEIYIVKVDKALFDFEKTFVEINELVLVSGGNCTIKIFPRDKFGNPIPYIEDLDIKKFQVSITLSNNTVIKDEEGEFDKEEKVVIFAPILSLTGEALVEVKYDNSSISCKNCTVNVLYSEISWNLSTIIYSKSLILGDISNITISPRDKNNNIIPVEKISNDIKIQCIFGNKSLDIISDVDLYNNTINVYNKDIANHVGNLTWKINYGNDELNLTVLIKAEAILENTKFYINFNSSTEEIEEIKNNTDLSLDVISNSDFKIYFELVDLFNNTLEQKDSAEISFA